jgi:hypothetical protein
MLKKQLEKIENSWQQEYKETLAKFDENEDESLMGQTCWMFAGISLIFNNTVKFAHINYHRLHSASCCRYIKGNFEIGYKKQG